MATYLPPDSRLSAYLSRVLTVCSSRARFVIEKIQRQGSITSDEIQVEGYLHGARAVGDVRDQGVPLVTARTDGKDGRQMAIYTFGLSDDIKPHMFGGRVAFPPSLKPLLIARDGNYCAISKRSLPADKLQIDHRVPYYIAGDPRGARDPAEFMLLSAQMQRAKSWACENCPNGKVGFDVSICRSCYWASPDDYRHVATSHERRLELIFTADETRIFDELKEKASRINLTAQAYAKLTLKEATEQGGTG